MFETRSEAWEAVGLEIAVNRHEARRSLRRLPFEILLLVAVIWADAKVRHHLQLVARNPKSYPNGSGWPVGQDTITVGAVLLVFTLGWLLSRDLAKVAPAVFRRMDPGTAGTVEFLIRLISVAATVLGALAVAGITSQVLAIGGAFTAVIVGLAAQQTLGNLFAGMVLLSARPFRLGERVRLQAGALAGGVDGVIASLGLLYTTLSRGDERIMVPNNLVLSSAIVPLREPDPVDVRVRLGPGIRPSHIQELLDANISTPTRKAPIVLLEEINGNSVVVRVQATPERHSDGAHLADEVIAALLGVTAEHPALDGGTPRGWPA